MILCVILHYGCVDDTLLCINSLRENNDVDLVICDNDPKQNIQDSISTSKSIKIFKTGGNKGFARANNMAVKQYLESHHDHIMLLNNDTKVVGNIQKLRDTLNKKDIGLVGPLMPYMQNPSIIWSCGGYIDRLRIRIGSHKNIPDDEVIDVDYLPGAAIMCKKDIWTTLKGLSEKYFLAYEEAEFACEVRKLGYRIVVVSSVSVLHKVGMSNQIANYMYLYNDIRGRLIFGEYLHEHVFLKRYYVVLVIMMTSLLKKDTIKNINRVFIIIKAMIDHYKGIPITSELLSGINK